jgi:hypothetical protein
VLSEVLKVVKLQGALFYNGEFSSPWSVYAAPSRGLARYFGTDTEYVIVYHLLTEGRASVRLENGDRLALEAGDIVMLPHGDTHVVENGPMTKTVDDSQHWVEILSQGLKLWRVGGGGEVTKFVCGYMACDPRLGQVFLSGLPTVFKVSIRNKASGQWLENSIRFSVEQADRWQAGVKQYWPSYRRCCLSKPSGLILRNFPWNKPVGWPVLATRRLERRWR